MSDKFIDTFINESPGSVLEAEIYQDESGYKIRYNVNGNVVKEETFYDKTIHYVEDAAKNWLVGIKTLNG